MESAWRDSELTYSRTVNCTPAIQATESTHYSVIEVEYEGMLDNSQFHGDGTLIYPMRQKIEGRWDKGKLVSWKYRFIDGLEYEVPWGYCVFPDRR